MLSSRLTIDASTQPGDAFAGTDAKIRLMADLDAWVLSEREASETGVFHGEQLTDFSLYAIMVHGFDGIKNSHQYGGVLDLAAVYLKEVSRITIGERGKGNAFLDRAPSIYIPPKEWPTDATRPAMENLDITIQANTCNSLVLIYWADRLTVGGDDRADGNYFLGNDIDLKGDYLDITRNVFGRRLDEDEYTQSYTTLSITQSEDVTLHDNETHYAVFEVEFLVKGFSILRNTDLELLVIGEGCEDGTIGTEDIRDANIFRPGRIAQHHNYHKNAMRLPSNTPLDIGKNVMYCAWPAIEIDDSSAPHPELVVTVNNDTEYSGKATPGADIYIYEDPTDCEHCSPVQFYDKVKADAQGRWRITGNFEGKRWVSHAMLNGYTSKYTQIDLDFPNHHPYEVSMDACGRGRGSIRLLSHNKHVLDVEWFDADGNKLGEGFELRNLSEGAYYAHAKNGNCYMRKDFWVPNDEPIIYDQNLNVIHPGCNGEKGSILGLTIQWFNTHPTVEWFDGHGNKVGDGDFLYEAGPGTYTLRVTGMAGCVKTYGPIVLENTSGPRVDESRAVLKHTDCNAATGSITGVTATGQGSLTYTWRNGQGDVVARQRDLMGVGPGSYTLEVTDEGICNAVATTTYAIYYRYATEVSVDDSDVRITHAGCDGRGGQIDGIRVSGADRFVWLDESDQSIGTALDPTGLPPGSYRLLVFKGLCSDEYGPYEVEERAPMVFPVYDLHVADAYCGLANGSITIDLGTGVQPARLRWLDSRGQEVGVGTQLGSLSPGRYTLLLTDVQGCETPYGSYTVAEPPELAIDLSGMHVVDDACGHGQGAITGAMASGGKPPYRYEWQGENGQPIAQSLDASGLASGYYRLTVIDANGCTAHSVVVAVANDDSQLPAPSVPEYLSLCAPGKVSIPIIDAGGYRYRLYDSPTAAAPLMEGLAVQWFDVYPTQTTTYYLAAADGTCESVRVAVRVAISNAGVQLSNTFSPNGDSINDTWHIPGLDTYPNAQVAIYNRNGQLVFERRGSGPDFDGRYKGADLPMGAYYYVVDLGMGCDPLRGSINLLR